MRATELAILYVLIGSGAAVAWLVAAKGRGTRVLDAVILVPFWPLYGPFLLLGQAEAGRGQSSSLANLLPDGSLVRRLTERLETAKSRIAEIDRTLAQPELDERAARIRLQELRERGDDRAAESVQARLTSIERLRRLRQRFSSELTEIDELLAQLRAQSEVVRLAGGADGDTRELVAEIVSRVDGLDAILAVDLDA
jgi:hypothetical protein